MEYAVKVGTRQHPESCSVTSVFIFILDCRLRKFDPVTDHQQGQERPDGGGGDPAEIRTTSQHHHPEGRESQNTHHTYCLLI